MKQKLILFDVDGTLYDNKNKEVPASTISALRRAKEKGHKLAIATGRAYFMLYSIDEIKHLFDDFILINGQHIMVDGKTVFEDTVETRDLKMLIECLEEANITYGFQSSESEAISKMDERTALSFEELNLNLPPENKDFYKQTKVFQMWCFCDEQQIRPIKEKNPHFDFVKWMTVGYDIIKKGQSKGKAIHFLQEYMGIATEDMIAFGDGDNDVEMLKSVGLGIAMGNATEKLKQHSDFVTHSIDEGGIEHALEHFGLI